LAFVSIERQNQLYVYRLDAETGLGRAPMFVKTTLSNPNPAVRQAAGAIHLHPTGKFVYLTNRASDLVERGGEKFLPGGENNVAVFAIDPATAEPRLIQNADSDAVELRTFGIEPSGRMLVAASIKPVPVRATAGTKTIPARLCLFHIGSDGRLDLKRHHDVETGNAQQFWSGMVTLP
jgi:6-phosphogluconolactonase (cycloisomerase 2 family)